jgi:hypothetical protein
VALVEALGGRPELLDDSAAGEAVLHHETDGVAKAVSKTRDLAYAGASGLTAFGGLTGN